MRVIIGGVDDWEDWVEIENIHHNIPKEILTLASRAIDYAKKLSEQRIALDRINSRLNREPRGIVAEIYNNRTTWITDRPKLWLSPSLSTISKRGILIFLRSLGKDVNTNEPGLKRAIVKKLTKLQQKRSETTAIIREGALKLLELDEENFREGLKSFISDYIAIRDAIREAGIADNTMEFYKLFDGITKYTNVNWPQIEEAIREASRINLDEVIGGGWGRPIKKRPVVKRIINFFERIHPLYVSI